jgi:glutamate 5-kinase
MKTELKKSKKIVVKIGSSIINDSKENHYLTNICNALCSLSKEGKDIILVTSGAISEGMNALDIHEKPADIKKLQALAAVGQQNLMLIYEKIFSNNGINTAQLLITHNDINDRVSYLNIKGTIEELLSNKIVPIINENDVVSTEEIKLGDNDNLASMISNLIKADLLIILTDQDGMYDKNPDNFSDAKLIRTLNVDELKKYDSDFSTNSSTGTGGFSTKIQAVRRAALSGTYTLIANGYQDEIIQDIFNENNFGTIFIPESKVISSKKQWLDTTENQGSVVIDEGACKALSQSNSLLFVGIIDISGSFAKGDVINCIDENDNCVAKGIVNYSSEEILLLKGKSSNDIQAEYHKKFTKEVIHADNLIFIEI